MLSRLGIRSVRCAGLLLAVALLALGCGDAEDGSSDDVRVALTDFSQAVESEDLDGILAFFSDDYASFEATGKSAVREWWLRVLRSGQTLPFDLSTAELVIDGNVAEVAYYDERGELACPNLDTPCDSPQRYLDFRLERDPQLGWLITGIPSEQG